MHVRRGHRGAARALLEVPARRSRLAAEVLGDAARPGRTGPGRVLGRQQRRAAQRVVAHAGEPVAPERRAQRGDARRRRRGPRCAPRRPPPASARRGRPGPWTSCVPAAAQGEPRVSGDLGVREAAQPVLHRGASTPCSSELGQAAPDEVAGALDLVRGERVLEAALAVADTRVPGAGAPVQRGLELRLGAAQLGAQHLAEQAVMAVALGRAVERDEREAGAHAAARAAGRRRGARGPRRRRARSARRGSSVRSTNRSSSGARGRRGPRRAGTRRRAGRCRRSAPTAWPTGGLVGERERGQRQPAGQPSVARSSASTSSRASCRPARAQQRGGLRARHRPARRDGARSPGPGRAGARPAAAGSVRDASATVISSGRWVAIAAIVSRAAAERSTWTSSSTSTMRPSGGTAERGVDGQRDRRSSDRGRRGARPASSQANGRGSRSAHSSSSVVLPNPAGATRTANGGPSWFASAATSRGRRTVGARAEPRGAGGERMRHVEELTAAVIVVSILRAPGSGKGVHRRTSRGCVHPPAPDEHTPDSLG